MTMQKPTPQEIEELRALFPRGAPRFDYREMAFVPPDKKKKRKKGKAPTKRAVDPDADAGADPENADDAEDAIDQGVDEDEEDDERAAVRDITEPMTIAISSEAPVLRYDWWEGEEYYEVLDHSPRSVIMDYARDGMPFVASHRSYDANSQHGLVENVRVESKKLFGDVRFSRFPESQRFAMDMADGIRKKVSVGYIVGDLYEQTEKAADGIPIRRYMAWMPVETSTVPIPADYSVGRSRAQSPEGQAMIARFRSLTLPASLASARSGTPEVPAVPSVNPQKGPTARGQTMPPENPATVADNSNGTTALAPAAQVDVRAMEHAIEQRVANIMSMCAEAAIEPKVTAELMKGSERDAMLHINKTLNERMSKPIVTDHGPDLSPRDFARFSFARAIMVGTELEKDIKSEFSGGAKVDFGFERELVAEMARRGQGAQRAGQMLPLTMLGRAGIDSGTNTTGAPFKFTQPGDFIPLLRNRTSVIRAGSTIIPGLTGPITFPKQTNTAGVVWSAENPGSDISFTNLLTTTVTLQFKSIAAGTAFSRQMLFTAASGNFAIDQMVQNDLSAAIGIGIDLAGLNGLGSSNQPKGVLKNTNIGSVTIGAQGGAMTYNNWVDLETKVGQANANTNSMAYITNNAQRGTAKKTPVLGNTASGVPVWTGGGGDDYDGVVNGYRAIATEQMPANFVKGTTSNLSAIVFGAWEHNLIGVFGPGFETIVDPYGKKFQGMVEVAVWSYVDVAQRYDGAFAACQEAT